MAQNDLDKQKERREWCDNEDMHVRELEDSVGANASTSSSLGWSRENTQQEEQTASHDDTSTNNFPNDTLSSTSVGNTIIHHAPNDTYPLHIKSRTQPSNANHTPINQNHTYATSSHAIYNHTQINTHTNSVHSQHTSRRRTKLSSSKKQRAPLDVPEWMLGQITHVPRRDTLLEDDQEQIEQSDDAERTNHKQQSDKRRHQYANQRVLERLFQDCVKRDPSLITRFDSRYVMGGQRSTKRRKETQHSPQETYKACPQTGLQYRIQSNANSNQRSRTNIHDLRHCGNTQSHSNTSNCERTKPWFPESLHHSNPDNGHLCKDPPPAMSSRLSKDTEPQNITSRLAALNAANPSDTHFSQPELKYSASSKVRVGMKRKRTHTMHSKSQRSRSCSPPSSTYSLEQSNSFPTCNRRTIQNDLKTINGDSIDPSRQNRKGPSDGSVGPRGITHAAQSMDTDPRNTAQASEGSQAYQMCPPPQHSSGHHGQVTSGPTWERPRAQRDSDRIISKYEGASGMPSVCMHRFPPLQQPPFASHCPGQQMAMRAQQPPQGARQRPVTHESAPQGQHHVSPAQAPPLQRSLHGTPHQAAPQPITSQYSGRSSFALDFLHQFVPDPHSLPHYASNTFIQPLYTNPRFARHGLRSPRASPHIPPPVSSTSADKEAYQKQFAELNHHSSRHLPHSLLSEGPCTHVISPQQSLMLRRSSQNNHLMQRVKSNFVNIHSILKRSRTKAYSRVCRFLGSTQNVDGKWNERAHKSNAVILFDQNLFVVAVSPGFTELFGYSAEEVSSWICPQFFYKQSFEDEFYVNFHQQIIRSGVKSAQAMQVWKKKDGSPCKVQHILHVEEKARKEFDGAILSWSELFPLGMRGA